MESEALENVRESCQGNLVRVLRGNLARNCILEQIEDMISEGDVQDLVVVINKSLRESSSDQEVYRTDIYMPKTELDKYLAELEKVSSFSQEMEKPKYQLMEEHQYGKNWISSREVHVELEQGLTLCPVVKIARECMNYPNEIMISNGRIAERAKNPSALLKLEAYHGRNLDIFVEQDENAERIARRLSEGLTTKAYFPNFGDEE